MLPFEQSLICVGFQEYLENILVDDNLLILTYIYGDTTCIRKPRVMMLYKLKYSPDISRRVSQIKLLSYNKHSVIIHNRGRKQVMVPFEGCHDGTENGRKDAMAKDTMDPQDHTLSGNYENGRRCTNYNVHVYGFSLL